MKYLFIIITFMLNPIYLFILQERYNSIITIDPIDVKHKQIYTKIIKNILYNEYNVTINDCKTNNYEIVLLFQILDGIDIHISTMGYDEKKAYIDNPEL